MGEKGGENLSAVPEDHSGIAYGLLDDFRYQTQGFVAFNKTVKLVIQLEIIHVDIEQAKTVVFAGFKLQPYVLGEKPIIIGVRQAVYSGFSIHLLVKAGIFYGD